MSTEYYSGGINGNEMLIVNGTCVEMKFFCWDCSNRWLTCDIEEKWMKSKSKGWNGEKWKEDDISKVSNTVLDLNNKGERWEGGILNNKIFGFGTIYNENNVMIYCGFMYDKAKVCYGISFYPDTGTIEYCGNFLVEMRHGCGKLYDKKQNLVYEGAWFRNKPATQVSYYVKDMFELDNIHFAMEDIVIGSGCEYELDTFVIQGWGGLKRLKIEDHCFGNVTEFEISNCKQLFSIEISSFCFNREFSEFGEGLSKRSKFCIKDCPVLNDIFIDHFSFSIYNGSFELKNLPNLRIIDLHSNVLRCIPDVVFSDLPSLTILDLEPCCFNESHSLTLSNLPHLIRFAPPSCCFYSVQSVTLSNLPQLYEIKLGENTFYKTPSLTLFNLPSLYCFASYERSFHEATSFVLSNLPSLHVLCIGDENFNNVETLIIFNLPCLSVIEFGEESFSNTDNLIISNLPFLDRIEMNPLACMIVSSLTLQYLPKLKEITVQDSCCCYVKDLTLANFPTLEKVKIGENAFNETKRITLSNLQKLTVVHFDSYSFQKVFCMHIEHVPIVIGDIETGHKSLYRLLPNHIYFDEESSSFTEFLIQKLYFNYPNLSQDDNPLIVTSKSSLPAKNTKWSSITVIDQCSLKNNIPLSFEKLPKCQYIFIQEGSYNTIPSLTISDLQQLRLLVIERCSFKKVTSLTLNNLPKLTVFATEYGSFEATKSMTIKNVPFKNGKYYHGYKEKEDKDNTTHDMDVDINMKELAMNNTSYEDLFFKILDGYDDDDDDDYYYDEEEEPHSFANLSPRRISSDDKSKHLAISIITAINKCKRSFIVCF